MTKDYLIQITLNVYQITEWWPETNLLKFRARNLANEILSDFILLSFKIPESKVKDRLLRNIEMMREAWNEARTQQLIDRDRFLLFQKEYDKIVENLKHLRAKEAEEQEKKAVLASAAAKKTEPKKELAKLNPRQEKIISILKEKEKAQVWEIKDILGQVTKRTIRRDLDDLIKKGLIFRIGEWNEVFYKLSTENQGIGQDRT